jgi:transcription elongation factor Elf1
LSPRKERYQTPKYIAQAIREKRKNLLHGAYFCPKCKMDRLRIQADNKQKKAFAVCPCGIQYQLNYVPAFEAVDYYSKFMDQWNKKQ